MKARHLVLPAVFGLALAACSPPATTGDGAPQAPAAAASGVQPGQWRSQMTMLEINSPMIPEAARQQMMAQPITMEECSTSSDVAELTRGNLVESEDGGSCSENVMNASGGRIEGHATCTGADGMTRTMQMTGTYAPTHVTMDVTMTMQTPQGPMSQRMQMVSDRIGDCPASTQ